MNKTFKKLRKRKKGGLPGMLRGKHEGHIYGAKFGPVFWGGRRLLQV